MAAMSNSLEAVRFLIVSKVEIEAKDNVGKCSCSS